LKSPSRLLLAIYVRGDREHTNLHLIKVRLVGEGSAKRVPDEHGFDATGLRMEIVY
jgi:predicted RNase H-like nuclease